MNTFLQNLNCFLFLITYILMLPSIICIFFTKIKYIYIHFLYVILVQIMILWMFLTLFQDYGGDSLHLLLVVLHSIYLFLFGLCLFFKFNKELYKIAIYLIVNGLVNYELLASVNKLFGVSFCVFCLIVDVIIVLYLINKYSKFKTS